MISLNQLTKFIIMGFSQGDFIQSEKVELNENYTKRNCLFFNSKDCMCRLKENTLFTKKCSR